MNNIYNIMLIILMNMINDLKIILNIFLQHIQELIIQRQTKAQFEALQEKANRLETQVKQERALVLKIEKSLGGVLGNTPPLPAK